MSGKRRIDHEICAGVAYGQRPVVVLQTVPSTGQVFPAQHGRLMLPQETHPEPVHTVFAAEHAEPIERHVTAPGSQQPFAHDPPAQQTWPVAPHAVHEPPAQTVPAAWHDPPAPTQRLEPGSQHAEPLHPALDAQQEWPGLPHVQLPPAQT